MDNRTKYNDIKFFFVAIAFISAFNYYLTYSNVHFGWHLIITYSIDTIEGWLAWWAVRTIIIYLDQKLPYGSDPLRRIAIQLPITILVGLLIIIALTELVSWIATGKSALSNFYTHDIFIFIIWFLVINGIYIGMHYYHQWKESEYIRQEEKKLRSGGFLVKQGKQDLLIPFTDIYGFYADDGYTFLQTWQEKKFLIDRSLDKTEELLPAEMFFRINRQYILHHSVITGFKRAGDGKLEVHLKAFGNLPDQIPVSRNRAVPFKKWYR